MATGSSVCTHTHPEHTNPPSDSAAAKTVAQIARSYRFGAAWSLPEVRWASLALALFLAGLASTYSAAPHSAAPHWSATVAFLLCYLAGGWEPLLAGLKAARSKKLDVDLLMIVAAIGAAAIGQVLDGGLLIVIFATSGAQEAFATKRTQDSVRELLNLAPEQACRVCADGSEEIVDTAALNIADVIIVRPGEIIGGDGHVTQGGSDVDQASITGEPLPIYRTVGDEVFAGTFNRNGVLQIRIARSPSDSVVARIVLLVEQASATKAKTQLFIDKIEQRYSWSVVLATLLVFFIPLSLGAALRATLLRAMTFMIVASPCAVVLATMPPLLSAIANAGRHGVLVKSAVVMERLGASTQVAFDKTGTLTRGAPQVAAVRLVGSASSGEEILALAAAAEAGSEHPLGEAVVAAAHSRGLSVHAATEFRATVGRGVTAVVNGRHVSVGSPMILAGHAIPESASSAISSLEDEGLTAVLVLVDGEVHGVLGLADQLRDSAAATVDRLGRLLGHVPVLLTGDNIRAATRLAAQVGIKDVRAGLLPQDKVEAVEALRQRGDKVLVVGDGVNDAPALAAADTGVAMGRQGSDLALHTADAVIVGDELATLPAIITLSRMAKHAVLQNLVLAAVAIIALVSWDLVGHLPLPLGVAGHEGGTVLIGLNGLRLLRKAAWRPSG